MNFSTITACKEDCTDCKKRQDGLCPGCIEADGYIPEWTESGRCRVHACAKEHSAQFCGICPEFPCKKLPQLIHWNPHIVKHLTELQTSTRKYTIRRQIWTAIALNTILWAR